MNNTRKIGGGTPSSYEKGGKALNLSPRLPKGGLRRKTFDLIDWRCE